MHSYAYQWNRLEMETCLASTFLVVHETPMFAGDVGLHLPVRLKATGKSNKCA